MGHQTKINIYGHAGFKTDPTVLESALDMYARVSDFQL